MSELFDAKIKQRTYIAVTPEEVYDTITTASEWDKFVTTGMILDLKPGGDCIFSWKDWGPDLYSMSAPGKVVEVKRPRLFSFQWGSAGNETTMRFELEEKHGGTILTITEDGYQNTPEARAMILECASGWGEAATLLKFHIEHGVVYTPPKQD